MNLPKLSDLDIAGKRVIVRGDLDVDNPNINDVRLKSVAATIKFLQDNDAKVILIGHRGRPEGKINNEFSLKPICDLLSQILVKKIDFIFDIAGVEAQQKANSLKNGEVVCLENLRFDSREESNDETFAKSLSDLGDFYVNEAFASSHRSHASIVGIPKFIPHAIGLRFEKEIENLMKVIDSPRRPLVFIVSGVKEDKLDYVKSFEKVADTILIGGKLPLFLGDKALESVRLQNDKVLVGNLIMDKEDITLNTVEVFKRLILKAGTVVVSGPLGRFEDEGHRQGTQKVFEAVSMSSAFKVAGGGDTEDAIRLFGLENKFDWVSVGGGAMLDFLSTHSLPGIDALL